MKLFTSLILFVVALLAYPLFMKGFEKFILVLWPSMLEHHYAASAGFFMTLVLYVGVAICAQTAWEDIQRIRADVKRLKDR